MDEDVLQGRGGYGVKVGCTNESVKDFKCMGQRFIDFIGEKVTITKLSLGVSGRTSDIKNRLTSQTPRDAGR